MFKAQNPRLTLSDLQIICHQLSFLLGTGVPILKALIVLAESGPPQQQAVLSALCKGIEGGHPLSKTLSQQPDSFPNAMVRVVAAAEKTGQMDQAFENLSKQISHQVAVGQRLRSALTYPACVISFACLMVAFLVYVQVPNFLHFFKGSGKQLPFLTQILVAISNPKLGMGVATALLITAAILYWQCRTPEGRRPVVGQLYKAPVFGPILKLHDVGQLSVELATLLNSGVNLVSAMRSVQAPDSASPYYQALPDVIECVVGGNSLAEALAREQIYPPLLISMIQVGDESGQFWVGLHWYGELSLNELNERVTAALQLIEPVVMGFLGLVVTFIALASFLPTYQLIAF